MPKVEYGSAGFAGTGNSIIILNDSTLDIDKIVFFISSSATESSAGFYDSSSIFTGGSAYGDENSAKAITHYRNIGGVKTKTFEATVNYLDVGEFSINVTTCTEYTILRSVAYES